MKRFLLYIFCTLCSTHVSLHAQTSYPALTQALLEQKKGALNGAYSLTEDLTLNADFYIYPSAGDLILDLNGHTIKAGDSYKNFLFYVFDGRTLTIEDENPNAYNSNGAASGITGGIITGGKGDRGGAVHLSGGHLVLNGGTIYKCIATRTSKYDNDAVHAYTDGCGGAVYLNETSTFTMNGGAIAECETKLKAVESVGNKYIVTGCGGAVFIDDNSTFTMTGGTIRKCHAGRGGGVYVYKKANDSNVPKFYMTGGVIEGNTFITSGNNGGGVYTESIFNMSGGIIRGNHSGDYDINNIQYYPTTQCIFNPPEAYSMQPFGGGVYIVTATGIFTMTGGEITGNAASSGAGVMVWDDGQFILNGGKISGNYAIGKGGPGNGGGVYVQNSTFNFRNGEISGNRAVRYGGAVNINADIDKSATFTLEGNCIVKDNMAQHGGGLSQEQGDCLIELQSSGILIENNEAHGAQQEGNNNDSESGGGNGGGLFIEKGTLTIGAGTIRNNRATGDGGGISLRIRRIAGNMTININGGNITGNVASKSGGGLDLFANKERTDGQKNKVNVYLNSGTLSDNSASSGGGIHIGIDETNSSATMNIGTTNTSPSVQNNSATGTGSEANVGCGGAISMSAGDININNGNFTDNSASKNGGAIYLGSGNITIAKGEFMQNIANNMGGGVHIASGAFKITENANIIDNKATNGGGLSVYDGTVNIANGNISKNYASNYGGGLFVYNTTSTAKDVIFSGGTFSENTAVIGGGGVCCIGSLNLSMDAHIINNTARNGGGIYMGSLQPTLTDGATMTFGTGTIRENHAKKDANTETYYATTAYYNNASNLQGIGGGIFMGNGTTLTFSSPNKMGLFNNTADNGADDIFANGNNTKIVLPAVYDMKLTDYEGPSTNLYWVEDYTTNDTEYARGTNLSSESHIYRYQYALKNTKDIYPLDENVEHVLENKYLCLALGYDLVFVAITKKGLLCNDDVAFNISYWDNQQSAFIPYTKIFFTGIENNADVTRTVALPAGKWQFKETDWGWRYKTPTFTPAHSNEGWIEIANDKVKAITVANTVKDNLQGIKIIEHSNRQVNRIKPE